MAWAWNHQMTGAGSAAHTIGRAFEFVLIRRRRAPRRRRDRRAVGLLHAHLRGWSPSGVAFAAGAVVRTRPRRRRRRHVRGAERVLPDPAAEPAEHHLGGDGRAHHRHRAAGGQGPADPARWSAASPCCRRPSSAFNPPMLVVAFAVGRARHPHCWSCWWWAGAGCWRLLKWLILAAPWVLLLNAVVADPLRPGVYTGGGGAAVERHLHRPDQLVLGAGQQPDPQHPDDGGQLGLVPAAVPALRRRAWTSPTGSGCATCCPTLVLLAPVLAVRARRRAALSLSGIVGGVRVPGQGPQAAARRRQPLAVPARARVLAVPRADEQARASCWSSSSRCCIAIGGRRRDRPAPGARWRDGPALPRPDHRCRCTGREPPVGRGCCRRCCRAAGPGLPVPALHRLGDPRRAADAALGPRAGARLLAGDGRDDRRRRRDRARCWSCRWTTTTRCPPPGASSASTASPTC